MSCKGPGSIFPGSAGAASLFTTNGLIVRYEIGNLSSYSGTGASLTDLQGNCNATLRNSPSYSANPGCLTFNGTNSYIITNTNLNPKLSPTNTSTVISIFLWTYMSDNGVLVSEQGATTIDRAWYDSQIERVGGTLRFSVWSNGAGFPSTVPTFLNTWYYVGFTYDGTTLRGYVNGSAAGSATYARQSPYNNGYGLYYAIGAGTVTNLGDGTYSNMRLGAFHVYNTALSATQVSNNFIAARGTYGV